MGRKEQLPLGIAIFAWEMLMKTKSLEGPRKWLAAQSVDVPVITYLTSLRFYILTDFISSLRSPNLPSIHWQHDCVCSQISVAMHWVQMLHSLRHQRARRAIIVLRWLRSGLSHVLPCASHQRASWRVLELQSLHRNLSSQMKATTKLSGLYNSTKYYTHVQIFIFCIDFLKNASSWVHHMWRPFYFFFVPSLCRSIRKTSFRLTFESRLQYLGECEWFPQWNSCENSKYSVQCSQTS